MRRLVETLANTDGGRTGRFRVVTVTSVSESTVTVDLAGPAGSGGTLTGVPRLSSYSPNVGDTALLWTEGAFSVLIGSLA